ncbi:circumsporozoite protein-like isoform X1 [Cyprinodon tularosa]|uniref:circumsporozoite protein-like isoform X1 n=1 Tax=Cyprinodon tularosa TaxID=77115 RepID=UPI0018E27A63|nr:circumsporozoite protein-like isoform X1 [Cyprinodon tularosa]
MTTARPLPPPPPIPPPCRNQPPKVSPPCPQHAAVPFQLGHPIQETGDQASASHHLQQEQNIAVPLQPTANNTPPSPPLHGQEDIDSEDGNKGHPVQETDPGPSQQNLQLSETTDHDGGNIQTEEEDDNLLP